MPDLALQPILGNGVNFSGMASYPPPDALPPGKMALAQNVRAAWGKPVVRLPLTTLGSAPGSGAWCAGGGSFTQDGNPTVFAAISYGAGVVNGHGTGFFASTNSGTSWTQLGAGYGSGSTYPYGQTTFDSRDTRVEFLLVTDRTWNSRTAYDLIVIQDGNAAPYIYGKSLSGSFGGGYGCAKVYQPPAPVAGTGLQFYTGFNNAWPLTTSADWTVNQGTYITLTISGGAYHGQVTNAYVYQGGDSVEAVCSAALNLSNVTGAAAGQFILLANGYSSFVISSVGAYGSSAFTTQVAEQLSVGNTTLSGSLSGPEPIEITTVAAHGLLSGQTVTITGAVGIPAINGTWTVAVIDSTHFVLNGSVLPSGTYTANSGIGYYGVTLWPWMKVVLTDGTANAATVSSITPGVTTEIQTSAANTLQVGNQVTITGVVGTIGAVLNGNTYSVASVIDSTHFTIAVDTHLDAYTSGGSLAWNNILVLYDPTQTFGSPTFVDRTDIAGQYGLTQIAYPLPVVPTGQSFDFTNVKAVTFSYDGPVPPVTVYFAIYEMAASGQFQGTTSFAAAYHSQDTRQIGPATYYPTVVQGPSTLNAGVTIMDDQRFWFDYKVNIPNMPTAALDAGVDMGLLFSQLPGQSQPYLCGQVLLGAWNAGSSTWTYTSGNATQSVSDWTFFDQDLSWPAPSLATVGLPTGVAMASTTQRLFVGAGNTLWMSWADRPFLFSALQQSDASGNLLPESSTSMQFDGQTIQTLLAIGSLAGGNEGVGSPALGVGTVFVFTDQTVLMMSGWDAESLSKPSRLYDQGTYAPWSVATFQTGWIFWATDGHIIRYGINPQIPYAGMYPYAISRLIVEDLLKDVPDARIAFACAGVKDECYYLALSASGSSGTSPNTFALVWDYNESLRTQDNVWFYDLFPSAVEGVSKFIPYRSGYRMHLYGFDKTGQLLEHVTQGQTEDAGASGVAWSLTFPELRVDSFKTLLVRRACVHCDANIGQLSTSRTTQGRFAQATSSAVLSTTSSGTRCVRYDNVSAGGSVIPGAASAGVTFSLGGTSPSGSVIHAVSVEMGAQTVDGPDVS